MGRPVAVGLLLLVVLLAGALAYLLLRPCPYTPLGPPPPGVEVACSFWDITCHKCT